MRSQNVHIKLKYPVIVPYPVIASGFNILTAARAIDLCHRIFSQNHFPKKDLSGLLPADTIGFKALAHFFNLLSEKSDGLPSFGL
jgi:hypothetical protein